MAALSVTKSSPYHQNQSLPSATNSSERAASICSRPTVISVWSSAPRAAPSSVQAALSSGWPIQMRKLASIQLPEWMREMRARGLRARISSRGRTVASGAPDSAA